MVQFTQTISAFPEAEKNDHNKQQQDTAEGNACCSMVLRMRKGKGKVKKEAKH